jgi:hypothetical protein
VIRNHYWIIYLTARRYIGLYIYRNIYIYVYCLCYVYIYIDVYLATRGRRRRLAGEREREKITYFIRSLGRSRKKKKGEKLSDSRTERRKTRSLFLDCTAFSDCLSSRGTLVFLKPRDYRGSTTTQSISPLFAGLTFQTSINTCAHPFR